MQGDLFSSINAGVSALDAATLDATAEVFEVMLGNFLSL